MDESRIQAVPIMGRVRKIQHPIFICTSLIRSRFNDASLYIDTWHGMRCICLARRDASYEAQGAGTICSKDP